jgi:hypothetical protein
MWTEEYVAWPLNVGDIESSSGNLVDDMSNPNRRVIRADGVDRTRSS